MPGQRRGALLLGLGALLLLTSTLQAAAQGDEAGGADGGGGCTGEVVISELMTANKQALKDEDGSSSDWVELHNTGTDTVSLGGYKLTDRRDGSGGWAFPPGVSLAAGQFLLVFASGKDRTSPAAPLHTDFRLSAEDGYLALLDKGGSVTCAVQFPELPTDVSFGRVGSTGVVFAAEQRGARYALLAAATPGKDNTGPRPGGPLIIGATRTADPRPTGGADIPVTATVTPQQFPIDSVDLVYVVGYGAEVALPMAASGDAYAASIPASAATSGALVRWYIRASDSQGGLTRDPLFLGPDDRQYWGTVVGDPADQSSLPVLELYCKDDKAPFSKDKVRGCSAWLNGSFYDNLAIGRRGVTSLNWPKPKIKVDSKQGSIFRIRPGMTVSEMNLNSEWSEPGENTFMREPLAWQVFKQMGVTSLVSFHLHARLNGQYFGKYAYVEQLDEDTLKRWGYPVEPAAGPLWKSTSGEFSNLRWDLKPSDVPFYWQQYTTKGDNASEAQALVDFARGLAGGAPVPRSKFLFDALDLPQVVNHMAAQTLLLNQDRCTKNFYIYRDLASQQWSMFPWDVESAFGIDRGLGGKPAPDYCILACEQWNSPLYCDSKHPQDLAVTTPWGLISAQYDLYTTGRKLLGAGKAGATACGKAGSGSGGDILAHASRKLLQDSPSVPQNGAAAPGLSLPANSSMPTDVDADLTQGKSVTGAKGTYNHLIDAILAVPRTRMMYMRRLRTLMDAFVASGRLQDAVTAMYDDIRAEAKRDAQQWRNPGDPDRGYQQLMREQLPIRKDQLFNLYGPQGAVPLIPGPQPGSFQLMLGQVAAGPSGYVEVQNPNDFAVDISGYRLTGALAFTFAPGTVIPPQDSVHAAPSVAAFKQARGGQGLFVVGPAVGQLLGAAASVQLLDDSGSTVAST